MKLAIVKFEQYLLPSIVSFIILAQNRSSITWSNTFYISSFLVLIFFFFANRGKKTIFFPNVFSALGLYLATISFVILNFQVSSLITLIAFICTFSVDEQIGRKSLDVLTTILSFIIGISLFFWLLHFNDILKLPLYRFLDLSIIGNEGYLEDYIFFIHNNEPLFPRFYSIFEEPGALGVLLTFVILANKYNFKDKRILVLLGGLIFTYSLAGYITFFVGLFLYKIKNFKLFIYTLFGISIVIIIVYSLFKDAEALNWLIFDRLSNIDERGLSHRNSNDLNLFYSDYMFSVSSILGMGEGYSGSRFTGSSYKFFIIDYGWLGVLSLMLLYISIVLKYGLKTITIFVVYFLAFLPQYEAFISWQILLFTLSCRNFKQNEI